MIEGRLYQENTSKPLLTAVLRTTNSIDRLRGLLGRAPLVEGQALLIDRCNSVHTLGMSYPIDLIYLDRNWTITKMVNGLRPWRFSACRSAAITVELRGGTAGGLPLKVGSKLIWKQADDRH